MAHISGKTGKDGRIVIVSESSWEIEHNEEMLASPEDGYSIEVSGGNKLVFYRSTDGEIEAYGKVSYAGSPPKFVGSPVTLSDRYTLRTSTTYSDRLKRVIAGYEGGSGVASTFYYKLVDTSNDVLLLGDETYNSWGTSLVSSFVIDPVSGHLAMAFGGNDNNGQCGVHELYLDSYINSTLTRYTFDTVKEVKIAHIPSVNKIAIVFVNSDNNIRITVGKVIYEEYFGSDQWYLKIEEDPVLVSVNNASDLDLAYDSVTDKLIITYLNNTDDNVEYRLCTVNSDASVSFGDVGVFVYNVSAPNVIYDTVSQKVAVSYMDNTIWHGQVVVGSISGYDIVNIGTPSSFCDDIYYNDAVFDANSGKMVIAYYDYITYKSTAVAGSISGNTITFDTPVVFDDSTPSAISAVFDPNNNLVVVAYRAGGLIKSVAMRL